ncbi:hypothetical protein EXIGLDRAFT_841379 [Exidia glandulosa HHB12029]|uniref:Uncharacterized protein n=1 Tax=Exidia glandulosa HHB12029 TaxID=1314781 RepID=A0A165ZSN8_EXIGL|nr:hypothetical protein EXIGLDRAFT_841379 [Exidia glandulosa HHB12029]
MFTTAQFVLLFAAFLLACCGAVAVAPLIWWRELRSSDEEKGLVANSEEQDDMAEAQTAPVDPVWPVILSASPRPQTSSSDITATPLDH